MKGAKAMYESAFIQQLKRTNVSANGGKTKERVEHLWKGASNELKKQIEQDTGNARNSIYRIYQTGSISVKLAVSFAQRLNIDPYYLTGETDENSGYSEEAVERFLREKGYSKLLDNSAAATRAKKKSSKRKEAVASNRVIPDGLSGAEDDKSESASSDTESTPVSGTVAASDNGDKNTPVEITESDMDALFHALKIRARVSAEARGQLEKVKYLLLY
jgi:hypothetical protein